MNALIHLHAQRTRNERLWKRDLQIIPVVSLFPADFQNIAKAARGDKTGLCAFSLDDCINDQRCAVYQRSSVRNTSVRHFFQIPQPFFHCIGRISRRCKDLVDFDLPRRLVNQYEIGKGATNVTANTNRHYSPIAASRISGIPWYTNPSAC